MLASTSSFPPSGVQRFRGDPPRRRKSCVIFQDGDKNDNSRLSNLPSSVVKPFKPESVFEATSVASAGSDPPLTSGLLPSRGERNNVVGDLKFAIMFYFLLEQKCATGTISIYLVRVCTNEEPGIHANKLLSRAVD